MATAKQKITLHASRDLPFNKLILSQANVRRIKNGQSIEDLAASIARRGLLQSLNVRPVLDGERNETGMFEVPAGGRRYRALELLVKQKRMVKTEAVPCIVSDANSAVPIEEDSLAENFHREDLHPLDMFRAFQTLHDQGATHEEIAARFFVSATFVQQRLRLAKVSSKLLDIYAQDGMKLDELMAFTVTDDRRLGEIEEALERIENRPMIYDPAEIPRAGVFVSINRDGDLVVDRGYVRCAWRLELTGFTDTMRERLTAYGLFHEIISWKLRMFVPTDTAGIAVLDRVLGRFPIERVSERETA